MTWKGVIIEESMEDGSLLEMVTETGYSESLMEGEDDVHHFHQFEISDEKKDAFVAAAKSLIKQGWYIHLCKDTTMTIIFKDKVFEFTDAEKDKIQKAKDYGVSIGILKEQLEIESLIRDPFD